MLILWRDEIARLLAGRALARRTLVLAEAAGTGIPIGSFFPDGADAA